MLTIEDLAVYLIAGGVTDLIISGYDFVEMPDRAVFLTPTGGAGEARERVFERPGVQVRCRGAQNDPADAEALADQVDRILMDTVCPVQIGGRHVVSIVQAGGSPEIIERDEARRYTLSCSYIVDIAR